jgi:hypothetical protein
MHQQLSNRSKPCRRAVGGENRSAFHSCFCLYNVMLCLLFVSAAGLYMCKVSYLGFRWHWWFIVESYGYGGALLHPASKEAESLTEMSKMFRTSIRCDIQKTLQQIISEISGSHGGMYEDAVFWVVAPRRPVEVYRRFRGACCLHYQDDCPAIFNQSLARTSVFFSCISKFRNFRNFFIIFSLTCRASLIIINI